MKVKMKIGRFIILMALPMAANNVIAKPLIQARIDRDQYVYAGDRMWFNGSQSGGIIKECLWDFGDGQKGQGQITTHIYQKAGIYTAKLKVISFEGLSSTAKCRVTVLEPVDESCPMKYRAGLDLWGAAPWQRPESDFNEVYWKNAVNESIQMGYNAIWFMEDHPYPRLIKVPGFENAQEISDTRLDFNQRSLDKLISLASQKNTTIGMLVYNILVPDSFKAAYGVSCGDDTPLTRRYISECTKAFYRRYPSFGELVVTVGEQPLNGAVEFCKAGIFDPAAQMKPQPCLIIRDQQLYPDQMLYGAESLVNWHPLVKITEEQFTGDALGPRGKLTFRATGRRVVYLNSRKADTFFFGAYKVIKNLVEDARNQHAAGMCVQSGGEAEWLYRHAFGYYMKNAHTADACDKSYFAGLIRDKFGESAPAELLLDTADLNSRILCTVRRQFFSRNWNWRADCGLVLESLLAMPTYSSFERPGLGQDIEEKQFTHWLAREDRFYEDYLTIEEFVDRVDRSASRKVVTPEDTIQFLDKAAALTIKNLPVLKQGDIKSNKQLWDKQLDDMAFLANLALFYARKTEAAITWQKWTKGMLGSDEAAAFIEGKLAGSIACYSKAMDILENRHGINAPASFRMVGSKDKAHYTYPYTINGGMRELLTMFKAEAVEIVKRIKTNNRQTPDFAEIKECI